MNVIAVDVGTTSVRIAIISFECTERSADQKKDVARVLASHKKDIPLYQNGCRFEQKSEEIWQAICHCSRECLRISGVEPKSIGSIAFSATCSLVVIHGRSSGHEVSDMKGILSDQDVIMWMDHRAIEEARQITESGSKVLHQFGGVCSPEFSLAKILWLKNHDPLWFQSIDGVFELPDWLVYRCIGGNPSNCPRSLCCVACKWGFDVANNCHCGLVDPKLGGQTISKPGQIAGYLDANSAAELGLSNNYDKENIEPLRIVVGTSLIDAHSGMLAMLSVQLGNFNIEQKLETTLCSLAGTSSCHMFLSSQIKPCHGIWGPYQDVIIEGYYLLEAGQSLTGKLIEMSVESHPDGASRLNSGETMYDIIRSLNSKVEGAHLDSHIHVLPTYHGNRSPLANPRLKGGIYGLTVDGPKSLLESYIATIESLCYETQFIVSSLGIKLETFLVSGGLMKNNLYMQTMADVLCCQVISVNLGHIDFMVMGSALLARNAAKSAAFSKGCNHIGSPLTKESIEDIEYDQINIEIYQPKADRQSYHERRFKCFLEFVEFAQRVDRILNVHE